MPLITDDQYLTRDRACTVNLKAMERFLDCCVRKTFPKKGAIIRPGDAADTLLYIVKGNAVITLADEEGNDVILAYAKAGEFIGEIGLFFRAPQRNVLVRSRTDCEVAEIGYDRLGALLQTDLRDVHADLLTAVGLQLSERLLKTSRRVTRLAFMDVAGRIARTLLDMCSEPEAMSHPAGTQVQISRQEIARIVGCSREVAGRALKQMADDGMISVSGMKIVIHHSR
jgi:CRP/FNR family cyclic AMP-dependent transcriptional regulator